MRRILSQRETFAYRLAADNPYSASDNPQKKKEDYFGLDIPGMEKANLDTPAGGGGSADRYNQQAAEEESGPAGTSGRMQKMTITPGGGGRGGGGGSNSSGGGTGGTPDARGLLDNNRGLYDTLINNNPGANIGTYRVDDFHEHDHGALDFMTSDPAQAARVRQDAFAAGAPYVLWQQQQWNADGSRSPMENRGDPTQNHFDHVHIAPIGGK
jgi:hypothetical protein